MRFDEVVMEVPDPEAARAFYARVLGLPAQTDSGGALVRAGRTRLAFRQSSVADHPRYHIAFAIPLAGFDEARSRVGAQVPLITAGGEETIVHSAWDAVAFYFRDPAGNILECIARRADRSEVLPGAPGLGIRSVCEVGLVVDDVRAMARALGEALGEAPFRGPGDELFAALGTEAGLLILVKRGREWYPSTGLVAAPSPLRLLVTSGDGAQHLVVGPPYRVDAGAGEGGHASRA